MLLAKKSDEELPAEKPGVTSSTGPQVLMPLLSTTLITSTDMLLSPCYFGGQHQRNSHIVCADRAQTISHFGFVLICHSCRLHVTDVDGAVAACGVHLLYIGNNIG